MLDTLRQRLQAYRPPTLDHLGLPQAAVLLPIVGRAAPTLLFTRRALHLTTHRGQVAFPGGKRDSGDRDLYATALRESEEEIALAPSQVTSLGRLSDLVSLHGLQVTPWVGVIPPDLPLKAEPGELDAIFEVPLDYFLDDRRTHTDVITAEGRRYYVPSYRVGGYVIWGLSAMMLVELLVRGYNMDIDMTRRPPGELRTYPPRRRRAGPLPSTKKP
ncbi:CoA pyrophosphatase [Halomonas piscis]|uniref:CoA pyrophosphatase n=1 Tax=Halomonas piscis TaxID=3031727 RepID=UPI0028A22163|nr:CoA pyrophosphatase [Halomonas piscis]